MTFLAMSILFYVLMLPILPIIFGLMYDLATPKKNIILGVTIPPRAQQSEEVLAIRAQYKKWLMWSVLAVFLFSLGSFFTRYFSILITWHILWATLAIAVPALPYVILHRRLKALKKQRNWKGQTAGQTLVDLSTAQQTIKPVRAWLFVLPFLISLVPPVCILLQSPAEWGLAVALGTCSLIVLLFYGIYRLLNRQRGEITGSDSNLNTTLTRIRRYNWTKTCLFSAWLTSFFTVGLWLLLDHFIGLMVFTCLYTFLLLAVVISAEFKTRRAQHTLTPASNEDVYADEDNYWIGGVIYYNPNDAHVMVNDRVGMGMSFNYARTAGKVIMGLVIIFMLSMPILCVWLIQAEFTPVRLQVEAGQLNAWHTGLEYSIPLDDIESVELLQELPNMRKISGSNMDTVYTGKFSNNDIGECRLSLNPQQGPFLLVRTQNTTYLLGGNSAEQNHSAYQAIQNSQLSKSTA